MKRALTLLLAMAVAACAAPAPPTTVSNVKLQNVSEETTTININKVFILDSTGLGYYVSPTSLWNSLKLAKGSEGGHGATDSGKAVVFNSAGSLTTTSPFYIYKTSGGFKLTMSSAAISADRTIGVPDADGTVVLNSYSNTWGAKQIFAPTSGHAGFNPGSYSGSPSLVVNGDQWYDSAADKMNFVIGGSIVAFPQTFTSATDTVYAAKGDILIATANDAASILPVGGTNGWVLTVDDTQPTGVKWASAGGIGDVTAAVAFGIDGSVLVADGTGKGTKASLATIDVFGEIATQGNIVTTLGRLFSANGATLGFSGSVNGDVAFLNLANSNRVVLSAPIISSDRAIFLPDLDGTVALINNTALTGNPTAPTQAPGNNTTRLATTAFVTNAIGSYLPIAGGTMTGPLVTTAGANVNSISASNTLSAANVNPILSLTSTWNTTGVANGILLNVVNTASDTDSQLVDLRVSSVSQFKVGKTGQIIAAGGLTSGGRSLFQGAGAASSPAAYYTGAPYTAGTGTTNFPLWFMQPGTAAAATTWSTNGTMLGINAGSGFAGNLLDFKVDGAATSSLKVTAAGAVTAASSLTATGLTSTGGLVSAGSAPLGNAGTIIIAGGAGAAFSGVIAATNVTDERILEIPDKDGTIAVTTDVPDLASPGTIGGTTPGTVNSTAVNIAAAPSAAPAGKTLTGGDASRPATDVNTAGGSLTVQSGLGTGTGTGSSVVIKTPTVTGSGSGVQTETTRLTVNATGATFTGPVAIGSGASIAKVLTNTATLDFGGLSAGAPAADLTVSVTGAVSGDVVSLGVPAGSVAAGVQFTGWVSSADVVTIRCALIDQAATPDPASGTFRVMVTQF